MTTGAQTDPSSATRPDGSAFVTLGGVAGLAAMALLVAGIVLHVRFGGSPPDGMAVYLPEIAADQGGNFLVAQVQLAARLLLIGFFVALDTVFRDRGPASVLAVAAGVAGVLAIGATSVLHAGVTELAGHYVAADPAARPAIAATAEATLRVIALLDLTGNLLAWGVGGAVFSVAILRTGALSRWLGWGGLLFAASMWLTAIEVTVLPAVTSRDSVVFLVGILFGIIWTAAMGVALVRYEPAGPGGSGADAREGSVESGEGSEPGRTA